MDERKFKLVDATPEENQKFADEFSALLKKFPELNITTNIVKKSMTIKLEDGKQEIVYVDFPTILIQKKIEIVETEVTKEESIPSTDPEVNPLIKDEPNQTPA